MQRLADTYWNSVLGGVWKPLRSAFVQNRVSLTRPEHAGRITFAEVDSTRALDCSRGVKAVVQELVEEGDWVALSALVEEWDQNRTRCPMNRRFIYKVIEAIAEPYRSGNGCAPMVRSALPDEVVVEVTSLARSMPENYVLSALAAQMRLWQAWDFRGGDYAEGVNEAAWARVEYAVDQAAELLDPIDAVALDSPLVAFVKFNMLPFDAEGDRKILELYETRVRLDAGDLAPHRDAGQYLLPRWFGSYEMIETTARQAVAWTEKETGLAAYAALYNGAFAFEATPLFFLDPEMYAEGTEDLVIYRRRDPGHVPFLVETLWNLTQSPYLPGMTHEDRAQWDSAQARIELLMGNVVRDHLTAVHPQSWAQGTAGALKIISDVMQDELAQGAQLVMDHRGVQAAMPNRACAEASSPLQPAT